jgi:hypothetical protein
LLVATAGRVQRWTPADVAELPGISPRAEYRALAFDPNGQMLWAAPSADNRDDAWTSSDVLRYVGSGRPYLRVSGNWAASGSSVGSCQLVSW